MVSEVNFVDSISIALMNSITETYIFLVRGFEELFLLVWIAERATFFMVFHFSDFFYSFD